MKNESKKISGRRDFLKKSAAVGTSLALVSPLVPKKSMAKKVELRFQNWFNESDMSAWQVGLDKFYKDHSNIDLKLEFAGWGDTVSAVVANATAGTMPDIFMASGEHIPPLASAGLVMDLGKYIQNDSSVNVDDFSPGISKCFKIWDRWWGFPYDQSTWGIYYNKSLFDEAGVKYPPHEDGKQWSLEEFVDAAKALTKSGEQWGVRTNGGDYLASCFVYSAGGRLYDDYGKNCLVGSPEAIEGASFMVDLVHKHKVAPPAAELAGNTIDYFAAGIAAMDINGQWSLQSKNARTDFDFDIGFHPLSKLKKTVTGGSGFCISANTKYPDECWEFLKSYTSSETLADMVGRPGRGIPARKSAMPAYLEAGGKAKHPGVFIEQLAYSDTDRITLASFDFSNSWNRHYGAVYDTGEGSVAEALTTVQKETNVMLAKRLRQAKIKI